MFKAYSTKVPKPVPAEFADVFMRKGWVRVNSMYGKRAAQRYFIASGPQKLRALRDAYLLAVRSGIDVSEVRV